MDTTETTATIKRASREAMTRPGERFNVKFNIKNAPRPPHSITTPRAHAGLVVFPNETSENRYRFVFSAPYPEFATAPPPSLDTDMGVVQWLGDCATKVDGSAWTCFTNKDVMMALWEWCGDPRTDAYWLADRLRPRQTGATIIHSPPYYEGWIHL